MAPHPALIPAAITAGAVTLLLITPPVFEPGVEPHLRPPPEVTPANRLGAHADTLTVELAYDRLEHDIIDADLAAEAARLEAERLAAEEAQRLEAERARRASVPAAPAPARPASSSSTVEAFLACTRAIESGGDYTVVSRDGQYHGAYQFLASTWRNSAIGAGLPEWAETPAEQAPPAIQDAVAAWLYTVAGNRPWGGRC